MRDGTVERFPVVVLEVLRPAKDLPAARVRAVEGPVPHVGPDVAEHLVLAADGLPPVLASAPEAGVVLVRLESVQQSHFGSRFEFWHFNLQMKLRTQMRRTIGNPF